MAICLSGIGSDGTGRASRKRPPAWGPRRGMVRGCEQWENPPVEQTVESSTTASPVGLLLVDDHQVVLKGLVSMLASERDRGGILASTTEPTSALRRAA